MSGISTEVKLRPVRASDATFLSAVANDQTLMGVLCDDPTPDSLWSEAIEVWSEDADEECFIISRVHDDQPLGWAGLNGLEAGTGIAWLKMLVLLPEYWGFGYGWAALRVLKRWSAERGIARLRLWTDECNLRARDCYERNEFVALSSKRSTVGSRGVLRDRVCMECVLPPARQSTS